MEDRTEVAVVKRAKKLGVTSERAGKKWSKQEDDIIRDFYLKEGGKTILRLPGRTEVSIKSRANKLGFYSRTKAMEWSQDEDEIDEIMVKYYPTEGFNVSKRLKNRSKDGVKHRARKLFLRKKK